ncbi:MAG: type II toxin-antitoxin system PemK/MazF family toxin [Acidobacteriaceae bacterium]
MRRSEVYWVAFDPSMGGKIQKTRPAVIVSNDAANRATNRTIVVPLTSQVERVYAGETLVQLNGQTRKATADQITTASKLRFKTIIGRLPAEDMSRVERVILVQLGIKGSA